MRTFCSPYLYIETAIFGREEKLNSDRKKESKERSDQKYHANITSGNQSISQQKSRCLDIPAGLGRMQCGTI